MFFSLVEVYGILKFQKMDGKILKNFCFKLVTQIFGDLDGKNLQDLLKFLTYNHTKEILYL